MNIDRGQESFTPEEIDHLRGKLGAYKEDESLSWDRLAGRVGDVGGSTLGLWVGNKYTGDNAGIAYKVNKFFLAEEARREMELQAPIVPGFRITRTAREVMWDPLESTCRHASLSIL